MALNRLVTLPALSILRKKNGTPCAHRALQRRRPVAGLFEADAEAGGEMVEIVFRRQRFGEIRPIGHQNGGGEVIRQLHPAACEAMGVRDVRGRKDLVEKRPVLDQARHMHKLEDAVGVVERLRQQDLAAWLVVLSQRVGHVLDPHEPHAQAQPVAEGGLDLCIDIVRRHMAAAPRKPLPPVRDCRNGCCCAGKKLCTAASGEVITSGPVSSPPAAMVISWSVAAR